jgi:hypothetical protein
MNFDVDDAIRSADVEALLIFRDPQVVEVYRIPDDEIPRIRNLVAGRCVGTVVIDPVPPRFVGELRELMRASIAAHAEEFRLAEEAGIFDF